MRFLIGFVLAGSWFVMSSCGPRHGGPASSTREAWNQANDPAILDVKTARWDQLPSSGQSARLWSGYWWPTRRGGIADRWQRQVSYDTYSAYQYQIPTPSQVAQLSQSQLNALSPAEKFDLYNGRADLPLTHQQWDFTLSDVDNGEVPEWHGICHGSAQASIAEKQPGNQAVMRLADGRPIVFYYADIQALVAGAYSDLARVNTKLVGSRCDDKNPATDSYGRPTDPNCRSINPGSFHLILTQFLGQLGRPLIGDMTSHAEIWNYPITGYSMRIGQPRYADSGEDPWAAPGTEFLVDVATTVNLVAGADPSYGQTNVVPDTRQVSYTLELDHYGRILGGEWTSQDHPAFLWEVFSKPADSGDSLLPWSKVRTILAASQGAGPAPDQPSQPNQPTQPTQPTHPTNPGVPADGTPEAYAVVRLVNTVTSAYLIEHAGITQAAGAALDRFYAGPDGSIGTADDHRFASIRDVASLVSSDDLTRLIQFAMANGWAGPG